MRQLLCGMILVGLSGWSLAEASSPVEGQALEAAQPATNTAAVPELSDRQVAQIEQAQTVATVSVTNVASLINRALSMPGMLSVEAYSYQLAVGRQWKGQISTGAELRIELKHCSQPLKKGEQYLVMMERSEQQWVARGCDQVIALADATAVLAYLNDHYLDRVAQK